MAGTRSWRAEILTSSALRTAEAVDARDRLAAVPLRRRGQRLLAFAPWVLPRWPWSASAVLDVGWKSSGSGVCVAFSMLERMRATVRSIGRDPELVARHIEMEGWPDEVRGHLEIAGLLSLLYRETGRLLALATDLPEAPGCDYIAMPGTIDLPGENAHAAAQWELSWVQDRLSDIAFDDDKDEWLTGFAAAEQAVVAANQILKLISGGTVPAHSEPSSSGWDDAARALKLAQKVLDEARAGRTHTTTPSGEE